MKLVAEHPEEDKVLDTYIEMIQKSGYPCCYKETFEENALTEAFSFGAHFDKAGKTLSIKDWTPSQRLWFYEACEEFFCSKECREVKEAFVHLVGAYDLIFKEESAAFAAAKRDYALYLSLENVIHLIHVDTYGKLKRFLSDSVKKGIESDIKTASAYYDKELSYNVIELNSIKVPIYYKDKKLYSESVIYGWSDMDFGFSYEFLKYDLIKQNHKGFKKSTQAKNKREKEASYVR